MAAAPELEPEAPLIIEAAPQVGLLAVFTVCLGMILAVEAIVRGFFGTLHSAVGWIPYLGNLIEKPIADIEHKVVGFLGHLESDIDNQLAMHFHKLARIADRMLYILELGTLLAVATVAHLLGKVDWKDVQHLWRELHKTVTRTETITKTITKTIVRNETIVKHVVLRNIIPRFKPLEYEITHALPAKIERAEDIGQEALKKAEQAQHILRSKPWTKPWELPAAAVALALAKLGLDWLRCNTLGNIMKRRGCNFWSDLEGLLGLFADVAIFSAMCEILPLLTTAFTDVATPFVRALTDATRKLCPPFHSDWATLNVAAGPRPPAQSLGSFPD